MQFMLSLATNPYDPFVQYGEWEKFDRMEGFNTPGLLARALSTSDAFLDSMQQQDVEAAIDSIVNNRSFKGLYVKVSRDDG